MSRADGFARIPDWFTREAVPVLGLGPREVSIYVALVGRADSSGLCWPSLEVVARETGQSVRAVREGVRTLAGTPLLQVLGRQSRTTTQRYRVLTARPSALDAPRPADSAARDRQILHERPADSAAEVDPGSRPSEEDPRNTTLARAAVRMTDAQRQNVVDAVTAVADGTDAIDALAYLPQELAYLDGLRPETRRKRMAAWAGLRSRAEQPGGDDVVEDDRLHDLLAAHGYVWHDDDTGPWATYREETAV